VRRIAAELGRAPSTISRESVRNSSVGGYRPYAAERRWERAIQLLGDLAQTFEDLNRNEAEPRASDQSLGELVDVQIRRVRELDRHMTPNRAELTQYLSVKTQLEASMALYDQLAELQRIRAQIEDQAVAETASVATAIGPRAINAFSSAISERLERWGYEAAGGARYDPAQHDVFADNKFRSAYGKGVRAILHAAFTIALADFCIERSLPHPGFLVLDSPLITYRAPGESEGAGPTRSSATAFYHDMEEGFRGQIIVMENTDPLDTLSDETFDVEFTKTSEFGRYGFFEPRK
jgi:hypothetical protein